MSNEQALREVLLGALSAWNRIYPTLPVNAEYEDVEFREMQAARQALALPTAAPVDEREAFEALFRERYGWDTRDFKRDSRGDYMDGNTVTAWMSWQARSALDCSADARDAERYRMVRRGQYWSVVNGIGDHLRGEVLDARIDAAIRARSETSTGAA